MALHDDNDNPNVDKCILGIDENRPFPALDFKDARQALKEGLDLVHSDARIIRVKGGPCSSKTNIQRFKDHCGANPSVVSEIWLGPQTTDVPCARIKVPKFAMFLQSLNFLHRHHRESEREARFDKSPGTLRKWTWCHLVKVQLLQKAKIVFPDAEEFGDAVTIVTVDGTHGSFKEVAHHELSQNRTHFSHKKKHAGLCHELGVHLCEPKLIWMNGSFPAGPNDKANFIREHGLRDKLAAMGKKALGDKGHTGCPDECSTFNAFDHPAVKEFKSRAQMRHEQFNGMLKECSTLSDMFRHDQDLFETCFEAACVVCQCRMEHGEPLFDVLAGFEVEHAEWILKLC